MKDVTDLYGKMAGARAKLGAGLFHVIKMHERRDLQAIEVEKRSGKCPCDGCKLHDIIEGALQELEV